MTQSKDDTQHDHPRPDRDTFGLMASVSGAVLYAAAIVFFVLPLEQKLDTFLVVSYLFVPAIIGGLLYNRIERAGGWT